MSNFKHATKANVPGQLPICGADIWGPGVWAGLTTHTERVDCPHCIMIMRRRSTVRFGAVRVPVEQVPASGRTAARESGSGSYSFVTPRVR